MNNIKDWMPMFEAGFISGAFMLIVFALIIPSKYENRFWPFAPLIIWVALCLFGLMAS